MNKAHDEAHKEGKRRRPLHQHWGVWIGVVLMLAALAVYMLTNREVLNPAAPGAETPPVVPVK
jgi:hypothetical protein